MENPIKMDDLGGTIIFGNSRIFKKVPYSNYVSVPFIHLF